MQQIIEVFDDTAQGMTRPKICRAEDGRKFVVKGRDATIIGLINEVVCARLGQSFGLPIPDYALLEMPDAICRYDDDLRRRFGGAPCFGSLYVDNLQEFSRLSLKKVSPKLLQDIFIFDYWIMNDDRNYTAAHGGNPNLFVGTSGVDICVVDHNLAFSQDIDFNKFKELHVGRNAWYSEAEQDLLIALEYQARMSSALTDCGNLIKLIPAEWFEENGSSREYFDEILMPRLMQFNNEDFWRQLL